ncbi:hypothetical protein CHISP_3498 [Chitinispirillum alkaliphilum]|nr:hypothetical protein CHISP_3498 [Chitinispirillum alkaliphilum]
MGTYRILSITLCALAVSAFSRQPPRPPEIRIHECNANFLLLKSSTAAEQRSRYLRQVSYCMHYANSDIARHLVSILETDSCVNNRLRALIALKYIPSHYGTLQGIVAQGIGIAKADSAPDIRFTATELTFRGYSMYGNWYAVLDECGVEDPRSFYNIRGEGFARHLLLDIADELFPRLVSFIDTTGNEELRIEAVGLLGMIGRDELRAAAVLLPLLDDYNWRVRIAAAHALRYHTCQKDEVVSALVANLEDPVDRVSLEALYALGNSCLDSSQISFILPHLISGMTDRHFGTRSSSLRAISNLDVRPFASSLIQPLIHVLQNEHNKWVLIKCLHVLSQLKTDAAPAVPALVSLLNHQENRVRVRVVETLGATGRISAQVVNQLIHLIETDPERDLTEVIRSHGVRTQ